MVRYNLTETRLFLPNLQQQRRVRGRAPERAGLLVPGRVPAGAGPGPGSGSGSGSGPARRVVVAAVRRTC